MTSTVKEMTFAELNSAICEQVEARVRILVERPNQSVAHRMDHLLRVARNAREIVASYPDADTEILFLAILLHDVEQPFDDKKNHVRRSAYLAQSLLNEFRYPAERTARVLQVIREHSTEEVDRNPPTSVEARILFDADKLDGVGANGILRVFALSQQMGRSARDTVDWYRAKIAVAERNIQTPEGKTLMDAKRPLVDAFLAKIEEEFF